MQTRNCTLDCGTMNFAEDNYVMTNTPGMLAAMASKITSLGILPELKCSIQGIFGLQKTCKRGSDRSQFFSLMGIPWGAPNDINTFMSLVNNIQKVGRGLHFL